MRTAISFGRDGTDWARAGDFVTEAERLGVDDCWVPEAWGSDAVAPLGYLAARTSRIRIGSGIIQLGTRTPAAIAQAAMTLSQLSEGRFVLGLGTSGPQVIEGLHGVPFARPLTRMRETIEIVRAAFTGGKISYTGEAFTLPYGDAKPMRLAIQAEHPIPIYLATLSPRMLRLTGEVADGWLGTSFVPETSRDAFFAHLEDGLAASGRSRDSLDVSQGAEVAFAPDESALSAMAAERKRGLAFSLGGMGTATTNFYNDAYSRQGWGEVAGEVRRLWQSGDRRAAEALITDDMVLATTLIGTEESVRDRLRVWRDVGIDTVRLYPAGSTLDERVTTLGRALDLVRSLPSPGTA